MSAIEAIRRAAALMRERHGPDHVRHLFWNSLAYWLDAQATDLERADSRLSACDSPGNVTAADAIARFYLQAYWTSLTQDNEEES